MSNDLNKLSRRQALSWLAGTSASICLNQHRSMLNVSYAQSGELPKFLIVIGCAGGASIIDGPLAQRASEVNQAQLNSFSNSQVYSPTDSDLRATRVEVDGLGSIPYRGTFDQQPFVDQHHDEMAVITYTGTSVNHAIAQKRALTGNEAWGGRTIQEAVASQFGHDYLLPNVNMASSGYAVPGHDPTLPNFAKPELISSALLWPLGLHGSKGLGSQDSRQPLPSVIAKARRWRNEHLDRESAFAQTFSEDESVKRWLTHRSELMPTFEESGLINKLNFLPESRITPLGDYGLSNAEDIDIIRQSFPNTLTDPLEAQAALAYLLITQGISVTVTIGPDFSPLLMMGSDQIVDSPPLAFDFSHQSHRSGQALMWSRMYSICDKLITLLKGRELMSGTSYWDRSMIYFATEFGRTRTRPENAENFGTGHHLNNGALLISPMIRAGRIYGGIDSSSTLTYGFDPMTGIPIPGREMSEAEMFSAIAHGLNLDVAGTGLPTVTALRS
jgi:hypothetical protein